MSPEQAASAVERLDCPTCGAPAGSPCRTRGGDTAHRYHTPRFILVPALRGAHEVMVPADRGPGRPWRPAPAAAPVRIGYAYEVDSARLRDQIDALRAAHCTRVFSERVGVRVKARPVLEKALRLAAGTRRASPERPVILTVQRLNRLARNAVELMSVSAALEAGDLRLELLTGALSGVHDPNGRGRMFFAALAAAAELDREHLRDKSLEGQRAAAAKGRHGGRPRVFDAEMVAEARRLRDEGLAVPEIAERLVVKSGKNAGRHPSLASVYRALAEEPAPGTGERARYPVELR